MKRARKGQEKNPLYLLNAFATKRGLVIGQMTINEKTNEIKAIPEMLDKLDIENAVISVDAIGCQKKIAEKIIEKKADYFLAVKANQATLHDEIIHHFNSINSETSKRYLREKKIDFHETIEKGHGRIEIRRCYSVPFRQGCVTW